MAKVTITILPLFDFGLIRFSCVSFVKYLSFAFSKKFDKPAVKKLPCHLNKVLKQWQSLLKVMQPSYQYKRESLHSFLFRLAVTHMWQYLKRKDCSTKQRPSTKKFDEPADKKRIFCRKPPILAIGAY